MVACQDQTNQLRELVGSTSARRFSALSSTRDKRTATDKWTVEARKILQSIVNLNSFLKSIRRAYLDISNASIKQSSSSKRAASRYDTASIDSMGSAGGEKSPFNMWSKLKYLTDKERDEIDLTAKGMIRQLMQNIDMLKAADQARLKQSEERKSRLFTRNSSDLAASNQLAAHRSAIVLYLQSTLAVVSSEHKDQQEIRIKRQLQRNPDLHHLAYNLTSYGKDTVKSQSMAASNSGNSKSSYASFLSPASASLSTAEQMAQNIPVPSADEDDIDSILTPQQLQQFEEEQSALLKQHQTTLSSIKTAETSLLEISALQSELVVHLTQQSEITSKLWEDSLYVSGRVEEGNKQLVKARERNKEGRLWLLVFLIGASLTLLFLDSY